MEGKKKNAIRQERHRNIKRHTGKQSINVWATDDTKKQFMRIKTLLKCNNDTAFEATMMFISTVSDDDLLRVIKGG